MHKCIKILAKRKRGNKSPLREIGNSAKRVKGKARNKKGNKSKPSRRMPWPCDISGKEAIFSHEYVIFYRRGNYLIEGETSPINRSIILHISFIQV